MQESIKYTNELLYESKPLKEAFAAIAHQWRQPLTHINAIVGSIDNRLYELGIEDPFLVTKLMEIEKITKEMSKSIDNYRGLYADQKSNNDFFSIKLFFNELQESMRYILKEEGVTLEILCKEDLSFSIDKALLKELVLTIINNAKDALVSRNVYDPRIKIVTFSEDNHLFIKICDNAGGMSKSVMKKIFEPSFTTKHNSEGTGTGLYMVKQLLSEKLNGKIDVKNVDDGACFTLEFMRKNNE